jgi:hypothetical protein
MSRSPSVGQYLSYLPTLQQLSNVGRGGAAAVQRGVAIACQETTVAILLSLEIQLIVASGEPISQGLDVNLGAIQLAFEGLDPITGARASIFNVTVKQTGNPIIGRLP